MGRLLHGLLLLVLLEIQGSARRRALRVREGQGLRRIPGCDSHSRRLQVVFLSLHLCGLRINLDQARLRLASWLHASLLQCLVLKLINTLRGGLWVTLHSGVVLRVGLQQGLLGLVMVRHRAGEF